MTKRERHVKKYIDAWYAKVRVEANRLYPQPWTYTYTEWDEIANIDDLLYCLYHSGVFKLRIVKGKRG